MWVKEKNLILNIIKEDIFLSRFPERVLDKWVDYLVLRKYSKNQVIYFPYEPTKNLFLVHRGRVRITKVLGEQKRFTFRHAVEGDFFGEEGVFGISTRDSFAESIIASEVWIIPTKKFYELLLENPEITFSFSKKLFLRTLYYESSMLKMISYPIMVRLVQHISNEMRKLKTSEGTFKITHQELANLLGVRRETISACLRELEIRGFIEKRKGSIIVKELEKMENWCKSNFSINYY
ncbi:MAG: Crp/Fnr family transcriptional regulator [Candidatus Hydrogenedentes bacterium]|nr:Crp/Fnr family transcriptional regulator [Candidatus Hydrogenedentota bacterium]